MSLPQPTVPEALDARPAIASPGAAAIIIGLSSTLQAAGGGSILRRTVGYPTALDNGRDLSRFLLLSPSRRMAGEKVSLVH